MRPEVVEPGSAREREGVGGGRVEYLQLNL